LVGLGTANDFAVLAGSTVTSTGPTVINKGDVGVSAGSAITGFPPGTVTAPNTFHAADAVAAQAQTDLTTAYNVAAGLARTATLTGTDLGGADADAWGLLLCYLSTAHGTTDDRQPGQPRCSVRFPNRNSPHHGIG
jgi:hypothetical protein